MDEQLLDLFVESFDKQAPEELVLDLDATDLPLHGGQEGRFFHDYYGHYCYLPLYIMSGNQVSRGTAAACQPGCLGRFVERTDSGGGALFEQVFRL